MKIEAFLEKFAVNVIKKFETIPDLIVESFITGSINIVDV